MLVQSIRASGQLNVYIGNANTSNIHTHLYTLDVQDAIDKVYATRKRLVKKMKNEKIDLILCPTTVITTRSSTTDLFLI